MVTSTGFGGGASPASSVHRPSAQFLLVTKKGVVFLDINELFRVQSRIWATFFQSILAVVKIVVKNVFSWLLVKQTEQQGDDR